MSQTRIPPPRNAARTSCGFCEGGSGQKAEGDVTVHVFGLTVAKEMQASRSPAPTSGRWATPRWPPARSPLTTPVATQSRSP